MHCSSASGYEYEAPYEYHAVHGKKGERNRLD
jgi:hypothetical protein